MKKELLITTGIIVVLTGISYVIYKKQTPPRFIVRNFSPTTMDGFFEWGKSSGPINNSSATFVAGWGWDAKMVPDATKKSVQVNISKNGKPYSSITVTDAGIYKI